MPKIRKIELKKKHFTIYVITLPDVFISHATEDKEKVARPLAEALRNNGLDVWFDEFSLKIGDNLRESVDNGIKTSRYGILILSKSFFEKQWTRKELDAFFAREITGQKIILPVWHELSFEDILELAPTLANRFAIKTSDGMEQMVNQILKVVKPDALEKRIEISAQPLVYINANKDSILVGRSIKFSGQCVNGGNVVHLTAVGPGVYTKGKEIASPTVSSLGKWDFEWTPEISIEPGEFLMKVTDSLHRVSDELIFRIEKGAVTMVAAGSQVYYIGEKVRLSGTSTVPAKEIFLSLKKHGLFSKQKKIDQLNIICQNNNPSSFTKVKISDDNTWSFIWDTSMDASELKKGYYTIYATEAPLTIGNLNKKAFSSLSVIIEQPFVSATASQSTIAQGDHLCISGTAEGEPRKGVLIWIFGNDFFSLKTVTITPDASFSLELSREETRKMTQGQYFVVVQHPMMNNEYDVCLDASYKKVLSNYPKKGTELFSIDGPLSKKGSDAAFALVQALNNPGIDDTYAKLQFTIEHPEIRFDPISDKFIGDNFTITARTNLAVDDEIVFNFSSVNPDPLKKFQEIEKGISIIVKVTKGEGGWNRLSFDVDTADFRSGKYLLRASALKVDVQTPAFFTILEK